MFTGLRGSVTKDSSETVIDHISDIRNDNRLCNLQLITTKENNKKAAEKRDYTFVKYNHQDCVLCKLCYKRSDLL